MANILWPGRSVCIVLRESMIHDHKLHLMFKSDHPENWTVTTWTQGGGSGGLQTPWLGCFQ